MPRLSPRLAGKGSNPRAGADLLVLKAVGRPVEPPHVKRVCLPAREAACDDDLIASPERIRADANRLELRPIVHLEPPADRAALAVDRRRQKGMRVDEMKLSHDGFDGDLSTRGMRIRIDVPMFGSLKT